MLERTVAPVILQDMQEYPYHVGGAPFVARVQEELRARYDSMKKEVG